MASESRNGLAERGAAFFEKLHYGIGAAALVGAEIISSPLLLMFGAWEVAHGGLWTVIKQRARRPPRQKQAYAT